MARPEKTGLVYFPLDVDIFIDPKVEPVSLKYGAIGEAILIRLLCRIYREGYALPFDELAARSVAKDLGDIERYHSLVTSVVDELIQSGFFDRALFNTHKLLSSRGIQTRYEKVCTDCRRKNSKVPDIHSLLRSKPPFTGEETPQRKEKETKVKKSESFDADVDNECESARTRARELQQAWKAAFGRWPTHAQAEILEWWAISYCDKVGMDMAVLAEAIRRAAEAGADNPIAYMTVIMENWRIAKIMTIDDVDAAQFEYDHATGKV